MTRLDRLVTSFKRFVGLAIYPLTFSRQGRVFICRSFFDWKIGSNVFISRKIRFAGNPLGGVVVGENVTIDEGVILNVNWGARILLGDNVGLSRDAALLAVGHTTSKSLEAVAADIIVGDNVWISTRAIVLPGVTIGENSRVGAGAVVTKDLEPNCVFAGVPAKMIGRVEL